MRLLGLLVGWAAVLGFALLEVLCWIGLSRPVPLDWLWAFTPYVFLPAWLVLVAAGVAGARWLALAAGLAAAGHLALLLPAMGGAPTAAPPGALRLRVVTANVADFNDDIAALMAELRATDAEVLVIQEVTFRLLPAIRAGLDRTYPHHALMPREDSYGSAIFSKVPLRHGAVLDVADLPMLSATARIEGIDVRLWDVHTRAPTRSNSLRLRNEMLDAIVGLRGAETLPLIAAGDYNATIWHQGLRELLDTGLTDAAGHVGKGLAGTWKGAPILESPIDHVLVSDEVTVLDVHVGEGAGSDHRPVIADLAVSAR